MNVRWTRLQVQIIPGIIAPGGEMQQLYPTLSACEVDDVYADVATEDTPWYVMVNVVTTVDGRAAIDGVSHGIGSATDHLLMRRIRSIADAVLSGAGTLLKEGIDPGVGARLEAERIQMRLRPQPLAVILGGHREISFRGKLSRLGPEGLIVFLPETVDPDPLRDKATVHVLPGERPDVREVARVLRDVHGVKRLLVEGGPTVSGAFLREGLVDEIFWTVAPRAVGGGDAPHMLEAPGPLDPPRDLHLVSVYAHADELYLRYKAGEADHSQARHGIM